MRSKPVDADDRVLEQMSQRRRVETGNVIAFEEGIHHQFPIAGHFVPTVREQMHVGEIHRFELIDQLIAEMAETSLGVAIEPDPDDSAFFGRWQRNQAKLGLVEVGESLLARDPHQLAFEIVAPRVVGADEQPAFRRILFACQPRAAMAAAVEKGVRDTRLVARQQDRSTIAFAAHERSRLEHRRRRKRHRKPLEQMLLLLRVAVGIEIVRRRDGCISGLPVGLGVGRQRARHLQLAGGGHAALSSDDVVFHLEIPFSCAYAHNLIRLGCHSIARTHNRFSPLHSAGPIRVGGC